MCVIFASDIHLPLCQEECNPRVWKNFHKDDILSIDLYGAGTLATSSYDGDIKVWSLETFQVTCVLNANDYPRQSRASCIPKDLKKNVCTDIPVLSAAIFSDSPTKHPNR